MKKHHPKSITLLLLGGLFAFYSSPAFGQSVLFDFDNAPLHSPLPIDLTAGGITAHFSANPTYNNYSIQRPSDVIGFTPVGFAGYCISPNTIYLCDLLISFNPALTAASIMYAPQELDTDSSCTMRITAYMGATFVGTNTYRIPVPGTWPTGTISFSSTQPFDNVVIHYDAPPVTGGDYGVIFLADNLTVTAAVGTPTPTPTPPSVSISGTISYCSNPVPGPVPNVALNLTGDATASTLSDASGNYQFSSLVTGWSYDVTPAKAALAPGAAGIDTIDAIAVQRHFLAIGTPLSGCRLTAADTNADTTISTVDVIAIQRFFLGLRSGIANVGDYQFSPASRTYSGIVADQTAQDYDTLIFGDVASSFAERPQDPSQTAAIYVTSVSALSGLNTSAGEIPAPVASLSLPNVAVNAFVTNFIVQVTTTAIDAKNKLVGFQGDFTFDERGVTFQSEPVRKAGITGGNWNVSGNVLPGKGPIRTLRISAYSNDFTPLSGAGTLFELRMVRVSKAAQSTQLLWAAPPDDFIFVDADLNARKPENAVSGSVGLDAPKR